MNKSVLELMKLKKQLINIADFTTDTNTFCELDEVIHSIHDNLDKSILCVEMVKL